MTDSLPLSSPPTEFLCVVPGSHDAHWAPAIAVYQDAQARVIVQRDAVALALQYADIAEVTDPTQDAQADGILTQLHETLKVLDEAEAKAKAPSYGEYKRILALFKTIKAPLAAAKETLKTKRANYLVTQVERDELAKTASPEELRAFAVIPAVDVKDLRCDWIPEIVDAAEVSREYCTPDVAVLRSLGARRDVAPDPIPGVRWTLKASVNAKPQRKTTTP